MSTPIQRQQTNVRMSQAVVANGFVFLAGQVPTTTNAPVDAQATEILGRIEQLLSAAGTDKTRIVTATIWLTDVAHFTPFNTVWERWIPDGHAPARACVQAALMRAGIDVEVSVTAVV